MQQLSVLSVHGTRQDECIIIVVKRACIGVLPRIIRVNKNQKKKKKSNVYYVHCTFFQLVIASETCFASEKIPVRRVRGFEQNDAAIAYLAFFFFDKNFSLQTRWRRAMPHTAPQSPGT